MVITDFLNNRGFYDFEGHSLEISTQVKDLINLSKLPDINIMEIGFNAGHSAEIFLQNNPSAKLTSFDLGVHAYCQVAKEYMDLTYPNRHTLILGDSTITLPKYIDENPNRIFDLIFIDGGHDYMIADSDLKNCRKMANKETIVIMDDTIHKNGWEAEWTLGPTMAWITNLNFGLITQIDSVDYLPGRGMSWGRYLFPLN
jgi:hypothetical protein